ncbi:MAG TPA: hypothetical protein VIW69_16785 [Candidatus Elarobacter sp.]
MGNTTVPCDSETLVHGSIYLRFGGRSRHIDFPALTVKTSPSTASTK